MYIALKHSHMLLAVLSLLCALLFTALAWKPLPARKATLSYVFTRVFGGLAALTGLAVTFVGPWQQMMYPYIGLILYVVHGVCCGVAKRLLTAPNPSTRRLVLVLQLVFLLATAAIMGAKPF